MGAKLSVKLCCCPECGSKNIQDQCWVMVNTNEIVDSCQSYMWCCACDEDGNDGQLRNSVVVPDGYCREQLGFPVNWDHALEQGPEDPVWPKIVQACGSDLGEATPQEWYNEAVRLGIPEMISDASQLSWSTHLD